MALCSRYKVELPKKGIVVAKTGKYPYVYHVDATYRNQNGTPTNDKRSIGKFDKETGKLIPNKTYYEIYEQEEVNSNLHEQIVNDNEVSYGEVREVGVVAVVETIFRILGVTGILTDVFGESRCRLITRISTYMLVEGNVMNYIDDFCENTFFDAKFDDRTVSRVFASLSNVERMAFFKEWVKLHVQNEYFAYDATSYSTYSKGIEDAEYGYNRDKESLPQINMALYMGQTSLLPMFYVTYPGSIIDKSHLEYMMAYNAELGIVNVGFILDRGFASADNTEFMRENRYPFILAAEYKIKAIQQAFANSKGLVQSAKNYILSEKVYGFAVKGRFYGVALTLHIFFDPSAVAGQTDDFFRKIANEENELAQLKTLDDAQLKRFSKHFTIVTTKSGFTFERNDAKLEGLHERFGYFFILTNQNLPSEDVVSIYRKRDVIEKGFDELKNGLDMNRLRTHSTETTDGKLFCAFLSLICRMHMQKNLSGYMEKNNFTNERIIRELSKIRVLEVNAKKRLLNPLTKTQRDILAELNISADSISQFVEDL